MDGVVELVELGEQALAWCMIDKRVAHAHCPTRSQGAGQNAGTGQTATRSDQHVLSNPEGINRFQHAHVDGSNNPSPAPPGPKPYSMSL